MATQIFFIFTPNFEEDFQFDEHIFQMSWNHQPAIYDINMCVCVRVFFLNSKTLWQRGGGVSSKIFFRFICFTSWTWGDFPQPSFSQATRDSPVKNEERFQVSLLSGHEYLRQKKISKCVRVNGAIATMYIIYNYIYCFCNCYYYIVCLYLWCATVIKYGILYTVLISLSL